MILLLCSLAAFFAVELFKRSAFLYPVGAWWKPFVALLVSAGVAAYPYRHHPYDLVAFAVAGAGLSMVIHKIYRLCSVAGDQLVTEFLKNREPRPPNRFR